MKYKCHGCFWKGTYESETAYFQICTRKFDMIEAVNECCKPCKCPHYITRKEVEKIADKFNGGK